MQIQGEDAVAWWRTSTDDQGETSPDTQIREALALAVKEGYRVPEEYILGTDWHSLSVWESPPMETLKSLIRERAVKAVFMYDTDRGPAKPAHRLLFRALCEEYGVVMRACHGQVPDGEMGEVMEFLSAWAKEKQVYRAQQGARDGLRDRARVRGLPTTNKAPYGYQWSGARFEPDPPTFHVARHIWELALEGMPLRTIARRLTEAGIPSPTGKPYWRPSVLSGILSNPVYKGTYTALRVQAVEPASRRGPTYGKTGRRQTTEEEQVPIPGLVSELAVSLEQFQQVQERLALNKAQGGKVVHTYLLRGRVRCEQCGRRMRGKFRTYNGRTYCRYVCSGNETPNGAVRCGGRSQHGSTLEGRVWNKIVAFLLEPEVFLGAVSRHKEYHSEAIQPLTQSMKRLGKRLSGYG